MHCLWLSERVSARNFAVPLGIAIVGGLIMSQLLTLFTTPVIYLYLDRLQTAIFATRGLRIRRRHSAPAHSD